MRIEEIQFGGMLTMALLTLTLAFLLPIRTASGRVFSNARWLMAGATSLLFVQFLLQYTLHFRAMGVTQGVFINLLFFVPCAWQLSLGVLYLLRNGKVLRQEWTAGIVAYLLLVAILLTGGLMNGHTPLDDTPQMRWAEYAAALLFGIHLPQHVLLHLQLHLLWREQRPATDQDCRRERRTDGQHGGERTQHERRGTHAHRRGQTAAGRTSRLVERQHRTGLRIQQPQLLPERIPQADGHDTGTVCEGN